MKILRAIRGETLRDKIRSDQHRQLNGIEDINKWANVRWREWGAHVDRMGENRLAKTVRDNRPQGVRSRGRPKETMEKKSQHSSLALNSGRTGASLKEEERTSMKRTESCRRRMETAQQRVGYKEWKTVVDEKNVAYKQ